MSELLQKASIDVAARFFTQTSTFGRYNRGFLTQTREIRRKQWQELGRRHPHYEERIIEFFKQLERVSEIRSGRPYIEPLVILSHFRHLKPDHTKMLAADVCIAKLHGEKGYDFKTSDFREAQAIYSAIGLSYDYFSQPLRQSIHPSVLTAKILTGEILWTPQSHSQGALEDISVVISGLVRLGFDKALGR